MRFQFSSSRASAAVQGAWRGYYSSKTETSEQIATGAGAVKQDRDGATPRPRAEHRQQGNQPPQTTVPSGTCSSWLHHFHSSDLTFSYLLHLQCVACSVILLAGCLACVVRLPCMCNTLDSLCASILHLWICTEQIIELIDFELVDMQ